MRRKSFGLTLLLITVITAAFLCSCKSTKTQHSESSEHPIQTLQYRFASEAEGSLLITSYPDYFNSLNEIDISWRFKSITPKTVEDYKQLRQSCVKEWKSEHIQLCNESLSRILKKINDYEFILPETPEIVFIETSMKEEMGAAGYTHKNHIYLGYDLFEEVLNNRQKYESYLDEIMAHELFHCCTTFNPDFKKKMYSVIGFKIDKSLKLNKSITSKILTNPDVPDHDSYAAFTINGKKQDCVVVCMFKEPYKKKYQNDYAFDYISTALVPLNKPDTYYFIDDPAVADFYEVMGHNTGYTIDPEECLADNFSFLITLGKNDPSYKTQNIIDDMADILLKGNF